MRVLALFFVLCGICTANAASLKYICTFITEVTDFPEFIVTVLVDDEEVSYYDSNIRRMIPKTKWMKKSLDKQYWDEQARKAHDVHKIFKANIRIAMQHFNSTQGVHTFQTLYGCQCNDETGDTEWIERYGYDGKDFFTDGMKTWPFIAAAKQVFFRPVKWNPAQLENDKQTEICIELLKYVSYKKNALERTVAPKVSLLQQDSSSRVTCHVTGFYPRGFMVTWQRNREDLGVNIEPGEEMPNEDGTFQTRSHLTVKPEDWKSQEYTCTVQHKSLEQDIVLPVKEENIKSNRARSFNPEGNPDGSSPPMGIIIGCVVGALILILTVIGVVIWKKRSSGYGTNNTSDTDSEGSDRALVKA